MQVKLFKINLKGLSLTTAQNSGSQLINELKNIVITFLAAKLVLDGQVTLGMMLSISYIIGQLNSPVMEMVTFIQHWQDAKLSLERLSEIHDREDEETANRNAIVDLSKTTSLSIKSLSFKYEGVGNEFVLSDLNFVIPEKKVTAIVGTSGSGKSTLLKLLLKFYDPTSGEIIFGDINLKTISTHSWRNRLGVVMQEGYLFNDTIANNITIGNDFIDRSRLTQAVRIANIKDFIESLPLGYNTKIGQEGLGLSMGQKQRILIARAIYKNPDYLFFDEATSALDANNEKVIMEGLNDFFKGKTVVVIAHRLSTVKNADQIVVLERGRIAEIGNHKSLTAAKGHYYELVKNQLELGN
jgi:ATP-binding cassette subfamily B protein